MVKKHDVKAQVLDIPFFSKGRAELLKEIELKSYNSRKTSYIFTPNPEQLVQAESDSEFKSCLQAADKRIPDGIGIVWATKLLSFRQKSVPLTERLSGADLTIDLLKMAAAHNWRVLLVGGKDYGDSNIDALHQTQTISIHINNQDIKLWWLEGYRQVNRPQNDEELNVVQVIGEIKPDIVLVAFGAPEQEKWALRHRELLEKSGVRLLLVVGGTFDYLCHRVRRAPIWLQKIGLEWLFRLIQEPWRWKRQLRLFKFIYLVGRDFFRS